MGRVLGRTGEFWAECSGEQLRGVIQSYFRQLSIIPRKRVKFVLSVQTILSQARLSDVRKGPFQDDIEPCQGNTEHGQTNNYQANILSSQLNAGPS